VEGAEARLLHVLRLLGQLVPYDRCALLEAQPGGEPRLVALPEEMGPDQRALLTGACLDRLGRLVHDRTVMPEARPGPSGRHLAVPLVALDRVMGVLSVERTEGAYEEHHLGTLSAVGAQLAVHLSLLRLGGELAELSRELEEARRGAEAASRTKDEFLAVVSHELKTPLAALLASAEALRSNETGAAGRARAFEVIERNVRAHAKLVDEILDLSCLSAARSRLVLRAVEPARVIEAAIARLRPRAELRSVRIEATLDPSLTLLADPDRLGQVVANLVANAIKFTPSGGRVEVRLDRAGLVARIQVIDRGEGISREFLPHVFEDFRQADASSTRAYGGLGIGLALVKSLVELQGGRVSAESPGEDEGATFTVDLPLAGSQPPAGAPEPPEGRGPGADLSLTGIRVLVVDDDPDLREVLQCLLERCGAEVTAAGSAAEALEALDRAMPDVLLSDIAMPGESGCDLMRKVAARPGGSDLPAAALSAHSREQDRRQALAAGFRMHLAKPFVPEAVVAAVAGLAGRPLATDPGIPTTL